MKLIPLTHGMFAMVDDADFELAMRFKWRACKEEKTFYAVRNIKRDGKWQKQFLHALLMNTPTGQDTHHKNENGLDDQRENLSTVTRQKHKQLSGNLRIDNTSGYRGVSRRKPWLANIRHNGRTITVGYFNTAEEAARARDAKARELGWPEEGMNFPL